MFGPLKPCSMADPGGRRVVHAHQDHEGLDAVGVLAVQRLVALVDAVDAAHAGADEHPGAAALRVGQFGLRIGHRPAGGDQRELADAVEHAQFGRVEVIGAVEVHRRRHRRGQPVRERNIEPVDRRAAGARGVKGLLRAVAQRRHHAHSGDGDAPHGSGVAGDGAASGSPASGGAPFASSRDRQQAVDEARHVADRQQLHRLGRQADAEFVLDVEQQVGNAEGVNAQRFERRLGHELVGLQLVVPDQNGAKPVERGGHGISWGGLLLTCTASRWTGGLASASGPFCTRARRQPSRPRREESRSVTLPPQRAPSVSSAGQRASSDSAGAATAGRIARWAKAAASRRRGANWRRQSAA